MKKKIFVLGILYFMLSISINQAQSSSEKIAILNALVDNDRYMKDQLIPTQQNSPFIATQLVKFNGLSYFSVDHKWRIKAQMERSEFQEETEIQTSDGRNARLLQYGYLKFSIDGEEYKLSIYRDQNLPELSRNPGCLFIPFTDQTTGDETYEGGRYLIVKMPRDGKQVQLDFNLAFNPYSAYHSKNISAFAPYHNFLPLRVTSGEKIYKTLNNPDRVQK